MMGVTEITHRLVARDFKTHFQVDVYCCLFYSPLNHNLTCFILFMLSLTYELVLWMEKRSLETIECVQ